jgi:cytochrome c-type biogenesis protein CcmH/NrfF
MALFLWLIPLVILVTIAVIWFAKRVVATSPAKSDSDVITTDQARQEERNEGLR